MKRIPILSLILSLAAAQTALAQAPQPGAHRYRVEFSVTVEVVSEVRNFVFAVPKAIEWPTQRDVRYIRTDFPPELRVVEKKVEGAAYFLFTAGDVKEGSRLRLSQIFECDSYAFEASGAESKAAATSEKSAKRDLRAEEGIEADSPRIRQLAKELTRRDASALENAERIYKWVQRNISYTKSRRSPRSAVAVLDKRRGDCASFAVLTAALARAAGIPTRIVAGFQKNQMDNVHIWNECYVEQRGWIPLDTAEKCFGRLPSGYIIMSKGSHLKLHSGEYMTPQVFQIYCCQYEVSGERPKVTWAVSVSPAS